MMPGPFRHRYPEEASTRWNHRDESPKDMDEERARVTGLFADMVQTRGHPMRAWFAKRNRNRKLAIAHIMTDAAHLMPRSAINYVHDSLVEGDRALPVFERIVGEAEKKSALQRILGRDKQDPGKED